MGFSVTKIIKNITMSLVFEPAPKTACLLYSSVTKKKKIERKNRKKIQEPVFLSSLWFIWCWINKLVIWACINYPVFQWTLGKNQTKPNQKTMISTQQIIHRALQKQSPLSLILLLECRPRCVCSSGCRRSARSHPDCERSEVVIYA